MFIQSIKKLFDVKSSIAKGYKSIPPGVNPRKLFDNLIFAKHYCEHQIKQFPDKPAGSIFRNYDVGDDGEKLFELKLIEQLEKELISAEWSIDPLKEMSVLFPGQLKYKESIVAQWTNSYNDFKGKIVVVDYEATVLDGASEHESDGFFDLYDLPPIDTWVYLTRNNKGRKDLYAWIPDPYVSLAKKAIEVNCLDLINWFEW